MNPIDRLKKGIHELVDEIHDEDLLDFILKLLISEGGD